MVSECRITLPISFPLDVCSVCCHYKCCLAGRFITMQLDICFERMRQSTWSRTKVTQSHFSLTNANTTWPKISVPNWLLIWLDTIATTGTSAFDPIITGQVISVHICLPTGCYLPRLSYEHVVYFFFLLKQKFRVNEIRNSMKPFVASTMSMHWSSIFYSKV